MNENVSAQEPAGLKRVLSFSDVISYGLLYFVPIAPMAVFGFIYNESRGMVALTYLIVALAMIFSAISYSEMARSIPLSGSVYSYVSKGFNPFIGFVSGWAILLDYLLLPAVLAVFGAIAMAEYIPFIPKTAWALGFVLIPLAVNIRGIQMNARLGKVLLIIQLAVLAVFCVFAVFRIATVGLPAEAFIAPLYNAGAFSMSAVFGAMLLAALSFIGFDSISTLNEETIGGGETVSKATMVLLFVVTFLFVLQVYLAAVFVPVGTEFTGTEVETAFYNISTGIVGKWFHGVILLTNAIIAILANALVSQATSAKVIYNMARDNRLPRAMAKLNKFSAPYISIVAVAAVSFAIAVFGRNNADFLVTLVTFGALTGYIMLNVTVIIHFRRNPARCVFKHLISPLLGVGILLCALFNASPRAIQLGCGWIVAGLVISYLLKRKNKLHEINLDI